MSLVDPEPIRKTGGGENVAANVGIDGFADKLFQEVRDATVRTSERGFKRQGLDHIYIEHSLVAGRLLPYANDLDPAGPVWATRKQHDHEVATLQCHVNGTSESKSASELVLRLCNF